MAADLLRYLDLTSDDVNELGPMRFAKDWFAEDFYAPFADVHKVVIQMWCDLMDPRRVNRIERQSYVVVHRDSAKTTISTFLIPMYSIFLKGKPALIKCSDGEIFKVKLGEKLIVIASETGRQAEAFVTNLKDIIDERKDMAKFFGEKNPKYVQMDQDEERSKGTQMWRQNAFVTADKTSVYGVGSGQQIRGKQSRRSRPTLFIFDDVYSGNNTITEESREKINSWIMRECTNSLDSVHGKALLLGTIVHDDTAPKHVQRSDQWFGVVRPIIAKHELEPVIAKYCKPLFDGSIQIPDKETCRELQKGMTTLSWPERADLYFILSLYKREYDAGKPSYFWSEYMNEMTAPEQIKFVRERFMRLPLDDEHFNKTTQTWEWTTDDGTMHYAKPASIAIGVDIASSDRAKADETVVSTVGWLDVWKRAAGTDFLVHTLVPALFDFKGGRGWGIHAETGRTGMYETVVEMARRWDVKNVAIETNAQQELVRREIQRTFHNDALPFKTKQVPQSQGINKVQRIHGILEPIFGRRTEYVAVSPRAWVYFGRYWAQLISLGTNTHDDWPDSSAIGFTEARRPLRTKQQEDELCRQIPTGSPQPKRRRLGLDSWDPSEQWIVA